MTKKAHSKKTRASSVDRIMREYRWKPASRFQKLDAQAIGEALEEVRRAHGVHMTAENVVEAAMDPASPLFAAFPWDDAEAAHQHRLEVARSLMRSVRFVMITPERKEVVLPAFVSTPRERSGTRHYTTTDFAMNDPELRAHVLKQALSELAAFRRKYAELSELAIVFAAIDKTGAGVKGGRRKAG